MEDDVVGNEIMLDFDISLDFDIDLDFAFELWTDSPGEQDKAKRREKAKADRLKLRCSGLDNLFTMTTETANEWGIPETESFTDDLTGIEWVSFNQKEKIKDPANIGIHHYIEDYQFSTVWNKPDKYIDLFRRCRAVVTPDFSNFTDTPREIGRAHV